MCLFVIEILFFIAGIWLIIIGKVPGKLFQLLFGKGDYILSSLHARLFGLLLVLPLPLVWGVSFMLGFLFPNNQPGIPAAIFEIVLDSAVAIAAIIIARRTRRPAPKDNPVPRINENNASQ